MAFNTLDEMLRAAPDLVRIAKTGAMTTVANGWFNPIAIAGAPGAGTLAGSSTTAGTVPTDATAGHPTISAFGAGNTGRIKRTMFSNTVAGRIVLFDLLFLAGAYAFNANTALTGQPSFASRVPDSDYTGLELWACQVTGATGNQAVTVTYTDDADNLNRSTGAVGIGAAPTVGRCWQLPFQAGDKGIKQITNVAGTVATAGTFNVMILRRLAEGVIYGSGLPDIQGLDKCGGRQIYADTALLPLVLTNTGTSLGLPDMDIDVING